MHTLYSLALILLAWVLPPLATADTDSAPKSAEEHAASKFALSATFETEWFRERYEHESTDLVEKDYGNSTSLDLGGEFAFTDNLITFANLSIDFDDDDAEFDEYGVAWSTEEIELSLGLQSLPKLEFDSAFISDPSLSLLKVETHSFITQMNYSDWAIFSVGIYTGAGDDVPNRGDGIDLTAVAYFELNDALTIGVGFMTDLADANAGFGDWDDASLKDKRTPALSLDLNYVIDDFSFTLAGFSALKKLPGIDQEFSRPRSWIAEASWHATEDLAFGLRVEHGRSLEERPYHRYGASMTWHFHPKAAFALEVLRDRYSPELDIDEALPDFDINTTINAQLTIRF